MTDPNEGYTVSPKQSPIEIQMEMIGQRIENVEKLVSVLDDRLTQVLNRNKDGISGKNDDMDKATSPMRDRLSNFVVGLDRILVKINVIMSELEL